MPSRDGRRCQRQRRYRVPDVAPPREPVADMMDRLSMPIPEAGCHAWLGKIGTGGYAYIAYRDGDKRLHRKAATVALELAGRPRPEGFEVDHTCRSRWCVNPDHMRYATRSENSLNWAKYTRAFCKQGHALAGLTRASNGACPICEKERTRTWRLANVESQREYFRLRRLKAKG